MEKYTGPKYDYNVTKVLRKLRKEKNLSAQAVADYTGYKDVDTVYQWELGNTAPRALEKRVKFLGCLLDLFGLKKDLTRFVEIWNILCVGQWGWRELTDKPFSEVLKREYPYMAKKVRAIIEGIEQQTTILLAPPLPTTHKIMGRDEILKELKGKLFTGDSVALTGMAGVGKTALAIELVNDDEVLNHFTDGVLWVGLGYGKVDRTYHLGIWGEAVGIQQEKLHEIPTVAELTKAVNRAIGFRKYLIVVDDIWRKDDAWVFKVGGPNCAYVVTSRNTHMVDGFVTGSISSLPALNEVHGIGLLNQFAPDIVQAERSQARLLVELVGGLPLALVLMGSFLRLQAHGSQKRRIRQALSKLHDAKERLQLVWEQESSAYPHPSFPDDREVTLQAVIDVSYNALDERLMYIVRNCSVFPPKPNSFSEDAALIVSGGSESDLDYLVDTALIEVDGMDRYMVHQVISDALSTKVSDDEIYPAHLRHAAHYFDVFSEAERLYNNGGEDALQAFALFDREWINIKTGQEWAVRYTRADDEGDGVYQHYSFFESKLFNMRAHPREIIEWHSTFLEGGRLVQRFDPPRVDGSRLYAIGGAYRHLGQLNQAVTYLTQSLEEFEKLGNKGGVAGVCQDLAFISYTQGNDDMGDSLLEKAASILGTSKNPTHTSITLNNLGLVAHRQGNYDRARRLFTKALEIQELTEDFERMAYVLNNLAVTVRAIGNNEEARRLYTKALKIQRKMGNLAEVAIILNNLGIVTGHLGDYDEAQRLHNQALEIREELEDQEGIAISLYNLGATFRTKGNYEEARRLINQALEIQVKMGFQGRIVESLDALGKLACAQGDYNEAQRLHNQALEIREELEDQEGIAECLLNLGMVARSQGDHEEAHRLFNHALMIWEELGNQEGITNTIRSLRIVAVNLYQLARAAFSQGDFNSSRRLTNHTLRIWEQLKDQEGIAESYYNLGGIALFQGNYNESWRLLSQSLELWEELGDQEGVANCHQDLELLADSLNELGKSAHSQGDLNSAIQLYKQSLEVFEKLDQEYNVALVLYNLGMATKHHGDYVKARLLLQQSFTILERLKAPEAHQAKQMLSSFMIIDPKDWSSR